MEFTEFRDKRALVTGAGKGIGRGPAVKLASLGAKVFAISRTQADLDSLKEQVPAIETRLLDISDWDITRKVVEDIGPIDLLVNNAAVIRRTPFFDVTKEELDEQHNINFRAAFNITQVVTKGMASRGTGGAVVNISSITGIRTTSNRSCYGTSKAALDMLTMSVAHELGPKKIRVNSVNPTVVWTDMAKISWGEPERKAAALAKIPVGRFAEVDDIVNATVYLLSEKSAMINGVILPVDGVSINGAVLRDFLDVNKMIGRRLLLKCRLILGCVSSNQAPAIERRLLDISDWDITRKIIEDIGLIDLLVNNAAVIKRTMFFDVTKEELDEQHNINFRAAFNITQMSSSAPPGVRWTEACISTTIHDEVQSNGVCNIFIFVVSGDHGFLNYCKRCG